MLERINFKMTSNKDLGQRIQFNQAIEEWIKHCRAPHVQVSSFSESVTNCDAYKKIVSMGREILPLIREIYDRKNPDDFALSIVQKRGLVNLVGEIVGESFLIPEEILGKIYAIEDYTKKWLDRNIQKDFFAK